MPTLLTNQSPVERSPQIITSGSGTASLNTSEFFFYSNSPETLLNSALADNGKFLNKVSVSGAGQIYTWHQNRTGATINNCILIHNPNPYAVKVSVTNYGLTNTSNTGLPDAYAWESYYNGQSTSCTVPASGYGNLFLSSVPAGRNFAIVARVNITKSGTSTVASVTMYDLAYITNSGNATAFAAADPSTTLRARGKGAGFYATLNFPVVAPTVGTPKGYKFAATSGFFSGAECSNIIDPSGSTSGPLEGGVGQQFFVTIPVKNTTGSARKFRIFIGSNGGYSYPFVNFLGETAKYTNGAEDHNYFDVIETDMIANGATATIQFSTVVTALASTPYFVGVRAL